MMPPMMAVAVKLPERPRTAPPTDNYRHRGLNRAQKKWCKAQKRYSDGIRDCLENFFAGEPIDRDYIIVEGGRVTSPSYAYAYES